MGHEVVSFVKLQKFDIFWQGWNVEYVDPSEDLRYLIRPRNDRVRFRTQQISHRPVPEFGPGTVTHEPTLAALGKTGGVQERLF